MLHNLECRNHGTNIRWKLTACCAAWRKRYFRRKKVRLKTVLELSRCLKQIKKQRLFHTCAPNYELPSHISTMQKRHLIYRQKKFNCMTNVWRCDQPPCNCFDGLTLRLSHSIFTFIYTLAAEKQQLARTTLSPPHNYSLLLPFTSSATWFNDLVYRLDMMRPSLCVAAKVTQAVSICRGSCVCVYSGV